ncbi:MAG: DUF47 family protein [Clostridiales bacterium]|nr:DUF47 family protein [Clostridiales bacterium]
MAKKTDDFYFNNFIDSASISCEMAKALKGILVDFNKDSIQEKIEMLHNIEHKGDAKKHEMIRQLVRAFITPLDRDDIIQISENIDNVTDTIEDVLLHIYINNIQHLRPDCIEFCDLIIRCCEAMKEMLEEFRYFKKSKKLGQLIININHIEEEGDSLYVSAMRRLHTENADPLEVIAWHEIYGFFEKCCDACEDVADIVESIAIENT